MTTTTITLDELAVLAETDSSIRDLITRQRQRRATYRRPGSPGIRLGGQPGHALGLRLRPALRLLCGRANDQDLRRRTPLQAELLSISTEGRFRPLSLAALVETICRTRTTSPIPSYLETVPFVDLWWPGSTVLAELAVLQAAAIDRVGVCADLACDATQLLSDVLTPLVGNEYLGTVDSAALLRARLGISDPENSGSFGRFVDRLRSGRLEELLSTPTVTEWVRDRIGNWATSTHESLQRITREAESIESWAGVDAPLDLVHLYSCLGIPETRAGRCAARTYRTSRPMDPAPCLSPTSLET